MSAMRGTVPLVLEDDERTTEVMLASHAKGSVATLILAGTGMYQVQRLLWAGAVYSLTNFLHCRFSRFLSAVASTEDKHVTENQRESCM
jgi:hypothetical protein